ncbi:MAG TPA: TonB-dependent receptor [Terriglobia bacterium]|nr:TonB-dependent receptor [Terriglobia bacterium]
MRPFTKSFYVPFFVAGMIVQGFAQAGPAPQPAEQATPAAAGEQSQGQPQAAPAEQSVGQPSDAEKTPDVLKSELTVTARRVEEEAQDVPIPLTVVDGKQVENAGAFNVNRLKELVPTVQFYSSNPRNSAVNIRGLGAPFGLTNDGIEAGVGFYVDGVYFARPAAATLDFLDVERIEVLRGPQGTLFGKNTTAGAISITTRRPSFTSGTNFELNYGNYGFVQAKGSITGPLTSKLAGRLSFSGTQRDGTLFNTKTQDDTNDLSNLGFRGQLLYIASSNLVLSGAADFTRQRPEGNTQVVAGVAPTLRPANRQYQQIATDLGYSAPSFNAFDRLTDVDTPLRSNQDLGGASFQLDWTKGKGMLTAITSWRYWNWDPSNDRDFIGLPVTTISAAPSKQWQWSQEVRYAATVSPRFNFVTGFFAFRQGIDSDPSFKQEQGSAAARFLLAPSAAASTPGLLDGYGFNQFLKYRNFSSALFSQVEFGLTNRLRIIPGLRLNYDKKDVDFDQQVYGGLQTTDPVLIGLQRSIFAPQAYKTNNSDTNLSGQIGVSYRLAENAEAYATYAHSFKSIGLNLNGLPTDALGQPVLSAATVKPEGVDHFEVGVKTQPFSNVTANFTVFDTEVKDFQAQVVNAGVGVLRGYLANAEKVRVRGAEFDGNVQVNENLSFYGALAATDGKYVSFPDAPPPLEDTGGPQVKDISGSVLPGISKWAYSYGGEYAVPGALLGQSGKFFVAFDGSYRSTFSSSSSASQYLVVPAYSLLNARIGFKTTDSWTVFLWGRNLLDKDYYEFLSAAPGNSGLYVGQAGDPLMFGVTLRRAF